MDQRIRVGASFTSVVVLLAACSSASTKAGPTTTAAGTETTLVVDTTDGGPSTTSDDTSSTTIATTTTVAEIDFTLRPQGIGPFNFNRSYSTVAAALFNEFGATEASDSTYELDVPTADPSARDQSPSIQTGFVAAYSRELCWDGFCMVFGGVEEPEVFTGWFLFNETQLALANGLTIGTRLNDSALDDFVFVRREAVCENIAVGLVDGITVVVRSEVGPFPDFTVVGTGKNTVANPSSVVVTWMEVGFVPQYLGGDLCFRGN